MPEDGDKRERAPGMDPERGPVRRTVSIDLFGQRLTVVSDAEEERVQEVVAFVNRRLARIRDGAKRVQTEQIALLAALNLAEELFEERTKSERLRNKVRERSVRLLASIDAVSRELDARLDGASLSEGNSVDGERQSPNSLPGA